MPKLPDKFDLGGAPAMQARAPAMISDMPVGGDSLIAGEIARGVGKIGGVLQAKQDEADEYEVQKRLVDFDLEQEKRLDDAKRSAPPEAKDFTRSYRGGYDNAATTFMQTIPDRLKPKVDAALVKRGAAFEKRAYDFELAERDRWNVEDVNTRTSDLVTRTMSNPDAMEDNAARGVSVIRASKLSARAKIEAERKFLDMNAEFGIQRLIDREIESGRDASDLIAKLRKVPKGTLAVPTVDGDAGADFRSRSGDAAAIRYNNPGAMYPGPSATKFGAIGTERIGGGHKIAVFPDAVAGAAAQFDLLSNKYAGKKLSSLVRTWSGGNSVDTYVDVIRKETGLSPETVITREMLDDPAIAVPLAKAMAVQESGKPYPLSDAQWTAGFARAKGGMLADKVERSALPEPGNVASEDAKSPKVDVDEDGRATLRKEDIGDTKADIPGAPQPGEPVAAADDFEEADDAGWGYLSPKTRRKLINYARTAGRAVVAKGVEDDIARLRLGREPEVGPDGRTSLDRARAHMTNMQWTKAKQAWDEAKLEHKELSGLRTMSAEEAADHVATMIDRAEGSDESIQAAARVQKKADAQLKKMIEMREKDPVRSVLGFDGDAPDDRRPPLPNTRAALALIAKGRRSSEVVTGPDGTLVEAKGQIAAKTAMPPQQQWETLFEARLRDQETIMPYETEKHRILSRREAEQLLRMPKDGKGLDERAYRARLEKAAVEAERKFGPKYAKRALEEAIGFHLSGGSEALKSRQATILRKMTRGEPINDDMRALRDIERVEGVSLSSGIDAMARIDRAGRSQGLPAVAPMPDPGRPAIVARPDTVTPGQVARGRVATPKGLPKSPDADTFVKPLSVFERATRWFQD